MYHEFQISRSATCGLILLKYHDDLPVLVQIEIRILRNQINDRQILPQKAALFVAPARNRSFYALCHDLPVIRTEPVSQRDDPAALQVDIILVDLGVCNVTMRGRNFAGNGYDSLDI